MKKCLFIALILMYSLLVFTGCETVEGTMISQRDDGTDAAITPSEGQDVLDSMRDETHSVDERNKESDTSTLTVSHEMFFDEETFQITGEAAQKLLSLLNCLSYDKNTCDGIPEYIITCPDQRKYYLNISSKWAWNDCDREAELSEDTIATISALLIS